MADSTETGPIGQSVINAHLMVQDETGRWVPLKASEGGLATKAVSPGLTLSGAVTGSGTDQIFTTLAANIVGNSNIRTAQANSVIGRASGTLGNVDDITIPSGKFIGTRASTTGAFYPTQILTKSSAYPLTQDDYGATVLVTAAATITLPAPATVGSGWWCCIKKTVASGSDVTIARNASETIDGRSASDVLKAQYSHAMYVTDGTNWHVLDVYDYTSAEVNTSTSFSAASGAFQNGGTTLSIPPGLWECGAVGFCDAGVSTTLAYFAFGMSTDSGAATFSDANFLTNYIAMSAPLNLAVATAENDTLPINTKTLTTTTTHYMKLVASYTGTAPKYQYKMFAVRKG